MSNSDLLLLDTKRINALAGYRIAGSLPESDYDNIAQLANQLCQTPIALIVFVDQHQHWIKANRGLSVPPNEVDFCTYSILNPSTILLVEDARRDDRFAKTPLVTGEASIVFYAGVPLIDPDGFALGSLCVMDTKVRQLSPEQIDSLTLLARQVINLLMLRKANQAPSLLPDTTQLLQAGSQRESHFELLSNTVPAMLFYLDLEQRYLSYNQTFMNWFGVDEKYALGLTVRQFLGEAAYQRVAPHLAIAYEGQQEIYEMEAPSRMGDKRWLSIVYTPHKSPQGQVLGIIVLSTDITKIKLAEIAVRESEARFRSLIEEAPVATCLFLGRSMVVAVANEPMLNYWGKGKLPLGKPLAQAVPELVGQPFLAILDEVFTTGQTYEARGAKAELEVDGVLSTYYFDFTYKPLRNATGDVYGIMDMAVDVTQQVVAHQQLQETEETMRGVLEVADMGNWTLDMTTGLTTYSNRLKELFEFTEDYITKENLYNPILESDRSRIAAAVERVTDPASDGLLNEEYTVVTQRTGRHRVVRAQAKMYFDRQGKPYKLVGSMRDITEERQTQWALEQLVQARTQELQLANSDLKRSNDNLKQFAYVASHDLQEPLRKIQVFSKLLGDQFESSLMEAGNGYLQRISSSANRMSTLVNDLLAYSLIDTRRQVFGEVSLNTITEGCLTNLDYLIRLHNAIIEIDELPMVKGDASQLGQLFQNLLTNAIKFTPAGQTPRIKIRTQPIERSELPARVSPTSEAASFYEISVRDEGIGFDTAYLDRIFQVFQRLHGKNEFAGTGVGLAICQRVAENHGGAITAKSIPGEGATFLVYLPV